MGVFVSPWCSLGSLVLVMIYFRHVVLISDDVAWQQFFFTGPRWLKISKRLLTAYPAYTALHHPRNAHVTLGKRYS